MCCYVVQTDNMTITRKHVLAFAIGSSILVSGITMSYLGIARNKLKGPDSVPELNLAPVIIALFFGLVNVLLYHWKGGRVSYIVTGALIGLLFSLVGTFRFNLPTRLFQFKTAYQGVFIAIPLYAFIWGVIDYELNKQLLL